MNVTFSSITGTEAALGQAGAHTIVVDRPDGKAGGMGLGFNGGELLALAIGGCFCNDLQYVAHETGIHLVSFRLEVVVAFEGSPLLATQAILRVNVETDDPTDVDALIARTEQVSAVANSLRRGLVVDVVREEAS